jgi:hypothetical protein
MALQYYAFGFSAVRGRSEFFEEASALVSSSAITELSHNGAVALKNAPVRTDFPSKTHSRKKRSC